MQQRKSKIVIIYFLFLIFLGSINNISLSKVNFNKVENIDISGLNKFDIENLLKDLKKLNLENIFLLDEIAISKIIETNTLIQKFKIFKNYPSTLVIEIEKTDFLAKINKNDSIFIIGSNGKLIKNNQTSNNLPFIFGDPSISDFLNLKKIIDTSKIPYNQIKNFYFFKSKRWDLELKNSKFIKLSSNNIKDSLDNAYEFLNNINFKNTKVIDARIKNQLILND